jgi:hypothetical protein
MKKRLKFFFIVIVLFMIAFILIPEKHYKQSRNEAISYVSEKYDVPPFLSKFIVNTKIGRKIAYIYTKKSAQKELKNSASRKSTK